MEKERQLWNRHFSIDEKEFLSDNIYKIILRKGEISLWMH